MPPGRAFGKPHTSQASTGCICYFKSSSMSPPPRDPDHLPRSELSLWWQLRGTGVSGGRGSRGLKAEPEVPGVGVQHWGEGPWGAWNEDPGHIWGLARSGQGTNMCSRAGTPETGSKSSAWPAIPRIRAAERGEHCSRCIIAGSSWAQAPWDEPWGVPMSGQGSWVFCVPPAPLSGGWGPLLVTELSAQGGSGAGHRHPGLGG